MLLITILMQYGELRLWNCERYFYAELILEIPADGCGMLHAKEETLEAALQSLWAELSYLQTGYRFSGLPQSRQ